MLHALNDHNMNAVKDCMRQKYNYGPPPVRGLKRRKAWGQMQGQKKPKQESASAPSGGGKSLN